MTRFAARSTRSTNEFPKLLLRPLVAAIALASGGVFAEEKAVEDQRGEELIDEVVVYGRMIETGQARAIGDQRDAKAIKTVISKELFGQVNDGNIATAMQRMPGLSADSNGGDEIPRYINIRGVATAFNSVQVDSARMPTSGTGRGNAYGNTGRGFALDDLPAAAIEKIEIIKAPTPDMDGDGLGGSVNLITKSALDYGERTFQYKAAGNYNALREETFPNATGTYIDQFDFGNGRELGVSVTASYNETNEGFDNRDLDYNPLRPGDAIDSGLGLQQTIAAAGVQDLALDADAPIP
ncbi:MAG: TonB-dependent receptor plug domain-containing protein [Gammaproteobacteria bacterium]|nr:TonB-dependent receptor plug domain-containing protein [Gammaproteobacteria bacterium]